MTKINVRKIVATPSQKLSAQHLSALYFASQGFKVVPIWPGSKKPMTVNGNKGGTTDFNRINKRWNKCPKANVAICTDGLLVLDVDVKGGVNGYDALGQLEALHGKLPATRTQETPSGGQHLIFKTQADIPSSRNCPATGIDVRARDGYILVDGSVVDGKSYKMDGAEIAEAPQWLVNLVLNPNSADNGYYDLYSQQSESETFINLDNLNDVITINGMGHSLKVKYDAETSQIVIVQ